MPHTVRVNGRRRAVEACQDVGQGIALLRGSGRHLPTRARARPSGGVAPMHLGSYANRRRCDKHVPFEPV